MKRTWIPVLVMALLLALPSVGLACPACVDTTAENRAAFLQTAAALTLLPLGMVGGVGMWIRKRSREVEGLDGDDA